MNPLSPTSAASPRLEEFRCRHIFTDGRRCGSASLRLEHFCYYHHTTRKPAPHPKAGTLAVGDDFHLAMPEDRNAVQQAIGEVLFRVAANRLDPRRAALLLYGLQIASNNLPKLDKVAGHETDETSIDLLDEVIADPELGTIAPLGDPLNPARSLSDYKKELLKDAERLNQYLLRCLKTVVAAFPDAASMVPADPRDTCKSAWTEAPDGKRKFFSVYPGDPEYPQF